MSSAALCGGNLETLVLQPSPEEGWLAEGGKARAFAAPGCWLPHRLVIQQACEQVAGKHEHSDGAPFLGAPCTPCSSWAPFIGQCAQAEGALSLPAWRLL